MQVVTGAISLEDQNTLPENAKNEVDPRPFQMLPPDFHLTHQTTPPCCQESGSWSEPSWLTLYPPVT